MEPPTFTLKNSIVAQNTGKTALRAGGIANFGATPVKHLGTTKVLTFYIDRPRLSR